MRTNEFIKFMIIEDLQEFMKLNNIDSETEEHTSEDKISRLQGKVPPSKGNKYKLDSSTKSKGLHKNESRKAVTSDDFDFDFPKKH